MMREILFKAKPKNWREHPKDVGWVEGYYAMMGTDNLIRHYIVQNCAITRLFSDPEENMYFNDVEIDPETLCQYTGLTDKDENRIWENDIVKIGANTLVRWSEKYAGWCLVQRGWMYEHFFGEAIDERDCEVVGNIFDNPELLKGDTE